jgi:hypothetical protein
MEVILAAVGERPHLNFTGSVTVADDPGGDAVDINFAGAIAAGEKIKSDLTLATGFFTTSSNWVAAGVVNLNNADYAIAGTTLSMRLVAVAHVTQVGLATEIRLVDVAGAPIVTVSTISTTSVSWVSANFTVPAGNQLVGIQTRCTGGMPPNGAWLWRGGIQIDRTF